MRAALLVLAAALALGLAVPALVSPVEMAAAIRAESRLQAVLLGSKAERDILARARRWLGLDGSTAIEPAPAMHDPLSARLADAGARVIETGYFQRARALVRLAAYRAAALVAWLALAFPLVIAAVVDGAVMRGVRMRSFAHLSPVLFGIGLNGTLAGLGVALVLLLAPCIVHPLAWAGLVALLAVALRTAVANFHRLR